MPETITAPHPLALDFGADFADLAAFLRDNPDLAARIPCGRHVSIPLKGETSDERLAELHDIAREMGTAVEWHGDRWAAEIKFGATVTLVAHHSPACFLRVQDAARTTP
jgi:hypothetical protein